MAFVVFLKDYLLGFFPLLYSELGSGLLQICSCILEATESRSLEQTMGGELLLEGSIVGLD